MSKRSSNDAREERVLAKPLIQAGVEREAGETVRLRPDQIARLEGDGYFEAVPEALPEAAKAPRKPAAKAGERHAPEGGTGEEKAK